MTVEELIKKLEKMPQNATIVITGCYGSETCNFEIKNVSNEDTKHYWSIKPGTKIVEIASDLCSG